MSWKWLIVFEKERKLGLSGDTSRSPVVYLWLRMCKVILGSFGVYFFPKMTCNSKMAGCRAKQIGIWDSGYCYTVHVYDRAAFKVILRSFSAPVAKWSVTPKRLVVEWNRWDSGVLVEYVWIILDRLELFSVQCHLEVIRCTFLKEYLIEHKGLKFKTWGYL